jgi:ferredoxin-type protein NapH
MRQKIRRTIIYLSLLLFPVTLNYFSPYVSIDGAFRGIVSGSVLIFILLFLSGLFFGRAWCSWLCPVAGLSEMAMTINSGKVPVKRLKRLRYTIFAIWFGILIAGFVLAGGIKAIDPLHMSENVISVDQPLKYIIYYMVLLALFGLSILIGKRGACHTICWMSPFLVAGTRLGRMLHLPQLRIASDSSKCIECNQCNQKCPMCVQVSTEAKTGMIKSTDCILCGECVDACPKKVLKYDMGK